MIDGDFNSIVILCGGALGDVVLTVPTLKRIRERFPKAKITLLADPYSSGIIRDIQYVDEIVMTHPKKDGWKVYRGHLKRLSKLKFDLLIDLHGTGRSRVQTVTVGGRTKLGYSRHPIIDKIYTATVPRWRSGHKVHSFLPFLELLGVDAPKDAFALELPISSETRAKAAAIMDENGLNGPFAIVHPTTSGRPDNELWPDEHFAHVAEALHGRGIKVAMTSGKDGVAKIDAIKALTSAPIVNLAGKTDQLVLAALLEKAIIYVGYNTGPMHIAAATNTPIVAVFETPAKREPWHPWMRAPWRVLISENVNEGKAEPPLYVASTVTPAQVLEAIDDVLSPQSTADAKSGS